MELSHTSVFLRYPQLNCPSAHPKHDCPGSHSATSAAVVGSMLTSHPKVLEGHFKDFRGFCPLIVQ